MGNAFGRNLGPGRRQTGEKMSETFHATLRAKKGLCLIGLVLFGFASFGLAGCAGLVASGGSNGTQTALSITNPQASGATVTSFQVSWVTSAPATSQIDYGKTSSYGSNTPVDSTMVTNHQVEVKNLAPGTTYHFKIHSTGSNGSSAASNDLSAATMPDTIAPTVSITSPAAGATLSATSTISATASDNVAVASVQFRVDGANVGSPVTSTPYTFALNTKTFSDGNHVLTVVATDTSGNSATSATVAVKVNNTTPDTTPPTVSLTAPANGATVSSTITVSANATDNIAVASVQFQLDGANLGSSDTTAPYSMSWNTTAASNGPHTLRAIATDTSNNSTASVSVTVTVNNSGTDTTPPTVSMTAPANAATVSGTVTVSANATDNVAVASVQFQLDGGNLASLDTTAPYSVSWNTTTASNGAHTLRAIAKDTSNNSATSASVTVTVNNVADTTPPTVPAGLTASGVSSSQINLLWTASTDNVGVTGYNVYRGGTKIGTSASTSYLDNGLSPSTSYTYTVSAFDAAGNTSAQSAGASATTLASSSGGIPNTLGWYQIPNSTVSNVCAATHGFPDIAGASSCAGIFAWSGGIADTTRNRLLVWGGGHSDYYGNEVYALDLNNVALTRLNNPSDPNPGCQEVTPDGKPNSRHTYGGISYISGSDQFFVYGGGGACSDGATGASNATWLMNVATMQWTEKFGDVSCPSCATDPGITTQPTFYISVSDFDPNTNKVFLSDIMASKIWQYDPAANIYKLLSKTGSDIDYHTNGVIDPVKKLFFIFGNGSAFKVDISGNDPTYQLQNIASQLSGCSGIVSPIYPGLAYDTKQNLIVGWGGGDSVYELNTTTNSCTTVTYPNGPGAQNADGTFGRFRYFPALNLFAVVNDWNENAYTLRLTAAGGTGGGSGPAISGVNVSSITTTGATVSWTTDVASTSQVEYGTTTAYGTLTTLNATLVTSHSQGLSGLTAGTLYHYRVHSKNSSGVESISGDFAFSTNNTADTTPPTVSMTSPAGGVTLSGNVTVSASASDNVGVAWVQFTLDGANLGSRVTSSPYTLSWDTTGASNGTHNVSAVASDAAGNTATAVAVSVTVSNTATSGITDAVPFATRCAAAGVFKCVSFDTSTDFVTSGDYPTQTIYPDGSGSFSNVQQDCTVAVNGCSLRFKIPAQNNPGAGPNVAGKFEWVFTQSGGPGFTQNSDVYIQFRTRMDHNLITEDFGGEGWKQMLFYGTGTSATSCSNMGLVTQNQQYYGFPTMFYNCSPNIETPDPTQIEYLEQAPGSLTGPYNCGYFNAIQLKDKSNCAVYHENEWETYYYHFHIGHWGQNDGSIDAWVAYGTGPLIHFIYQPTWTYNFNINSNDVYDHVAFTPYITGRLDTNVAPADGFMWFDELILSSKPIPAPNGSTP